VPRKSRHTGGRGHGRPSTQLLGTPCTLFPLMLHPIGRALNQSLCIGLLRVRCMCLGFFSDFNRLLVLPGLLPARSPTVIEWKERWSSENKKGRWWSNSSGKGNWQRARKSGGWAKGGRATDLPARGWFTRCYRSSGLPIIATTALTNKTELGCAASPELPERSMGTNSSRKNTNSNSQQKDNSNSRTEPYQ
jgi:hypothetical protein